MVAVVVAVVAEVVVGVVVGKPSRRMFFLVQKHKNAKKKIPLIMKIYIAHDQKLLCTLDLSKQKQIMPQQSFMKVSKFVEFLFEKP